MCEIGQFFSRRTIVHIHNAVSTQNARLCQVVLLVVEKISTSMLCCSSVARMSVFVSHIRLRTAFRTQNTLVYDTSTMMARFGLEAFETAASHRTPPAQPVCYTEQ